MPPLGTCCNIAYRRPMTAHIHMICGLTGAGKTTYSERLRRDLSGARFSIDDWMARLFFMDRDPASDFDWFYERVQRCCSQMRDTAADVLTGGMPVVFDCGFTNLHERQIFYNWADEQGWPVTLHFLDVDPDTCWSRVEQRNAEQGETFSLHVTRDMFDFMRRIWQPPEETELAARSGLRIEG